MVGRAWVNGFGDSFSFLNAFKGGGYNHAFTAHGTTIDANGFPTSTPSDNGLQINPLRTPPGYTGFFVIKFTGQGGIALDLDASATVVITENNTGPTGTFFNQNSVGIIGTNGRMVFSTTSPIGAGHFFGGTGVVYSGMGNLVLCRLADEALLDAGDIFNPDFIAVLAAMNLKGFRPMDVLATNNSSQTLWDNRPVTTALTINYGWRPQLAVGPGV